ncbi:unnamed protein product, partial [Ixodes persulcatus]
MFRLQNCLMSDRTSAFNPATHPNPVCRFILFFPTTLSPRRVLNIRPVLTESFRSRCTTWTRDQSVRCMRKSTSLRRSMTVRGPCQWRCNYGDSPFFSDRIMKPYPGTWGEWL